MKLSTLIIPIVITVCVTVVLLLGYESVKPITSRPHNFIPLPQTFPGLSDLTSSSCKTLTPCDSSGKCTGCGSASNTDPASVYQCTPVGSGENVVFNGEKVPPGTWCLPRGKENLVCGTHTGRAIWTEHKGWECVCLYPDLFGGETCNTQIACKSPNAPGVDQSNNVIVNKLTGDIWDPTNPDFDPVETTPYDTDVNGDPLYVCRCDKSQTKKFVNLPGDPYRCHLEPCSDEHEIPFWDETTLRCDCTAKGSVTNEYAYSNVTKKCVRTPQCAWDDTDQKCMCPDGQITQTCNSSTMKRTDTTAPDCPDIPGGSFCNNPCEGYCLNGGIGRIEGNKCVCTCPKKPNIEFHGPRCDDACMKDGVSDPVRRCCSGKRHLVVAGQGPYAVSYYKCGSASCFISTAKVTMADGTKKNICDIKTGDELMSAHDGKSNHVWFVDKVKLDGRKLIGVNDANGVSQDPFVTEDHCFFGQNGERLAYNHLLAKYQKHWETVEPYTKKVVIKESDPETPVFDVITDDHTLIVNDVKFYDDMPEIDKHPEVSLACVLLGKTIFSETGNEPIPREIVDEIAEDVFTTHGAKVSKYIKNNINNVDSLFKSNMEWFLYMANTDTSCLHVCSSLWKYKFAQLKNEINKSS